MPIPQLSALRSLLCKTDQSQMARGMSQELSFLFSAQQKSIEQEVRERCSKLELAYARIDIAADIMASWRTRVEQLKKLAEIGDGQPQESASAGSELLRSEATWLQRQLAARLAEIDLAESLGDLAQRCCRGEPWFSPAIME